MKAGVSLRLVREPKAPISPKALPAPTDAVLRLFDESRTDRLERLAQLAARILGVPTAFVSILTEHDQHYRGAHNWPHERHERRLAICNLTLEQDAPLVIPDTRCEPRLANNPLLKGQGAIRFYAGAPIHAAGGEPIGALCAVDTHPRVEPSPEQIDVLRMLADVVSGEIALTEALRGTAQARQHMHEAAQAVPYGLVMEDDQGRVIVSNVAFEQFCGVSAGVILPGMPMADVLALLAMSGQFPAADAGEKAWADERRRRALPSAERLRLADGRQILVSRHGTESAGIVWLWAPLGRQRKRVEAAGRMATSAPTTLEKIGPAGWAHLHEDLSEADFIEVRQGLVRDITQRNGQLVLATTSGDEDSIARTAAAIATLAGNLGAAETHLAAQVVNRFPGDRAALETLFDATTKLIRDFEVERLEP